MLADPSIGTFGLIRELSLVREDSFGLDSREWFMVRLRASGMCVQCALHVGILALFLALFMMSLVMELQFYIVPNLSFGAY